MFLCFEVRGYLGSDMDFDLRKWLLDNYNRVVSLYNQLLGTNRWHGQEAFLSFLGKNYKLGKKKVVFYLK